MVDLNKAADHAIRNFDFNAAAFYGSARGLSLGVGLIYDNVVYPLFNKDELLFDTVRGLAYILTHECDVDQQNIRYFNDYIIICPIIKFEEFAQDFSESHSIDSLFGLIPDIAKNNVFRVQYFPPIPNHLVRGVLSYGGLLYLNQICCAHVSVFQGDEIHQVCALSSYGLQIMDYKVQNHLFRPKEEFLPRLH